MKQNTKNSTLNKATILLLIIILLVFNNQFAFAQNLNNKKIKLQATLTPPYVIGPGDQVTIVDRTLRDLFGQVETYNLTVSSDGYISIPLPDGKQKSLLAAGTTLEELSSEVRELFGQTLKNPLVFLQISKYRPINVYLGGAVVRPGIYKIETASTQEEGGRTSTSASNTFGLFLTQAIQLAGGLKPRADIRQITVTRGTSGNKKEVDFKALITGQSYLEDISLQPGDAIFIPFTSVVEDQAQANVLLLGKLAYQEVPISVVGEAKRTGNFTLPNNSTLADAIGYAGGANDVGTLKRIRLSRFDKHGVYQTQNIDVHDLIREGLGFHQIALKPHDRIELVASKGKEVRHFFRDISSNVATSFINTVGGYIVQDNMLDRLNRASRGGLGGGSGSSTPPVTIFTTPAAPSSTSE